MRGGRGKTWTPLDDERLIALSRDRKHKFVACELGRSVAAVQVRLSFLRRKGKADPRGHIKPLPKKSYRGVRPCMTCQREFTSWDIRQNRICPSCSRGASLTTFDVPASLRR